MDARKQTTLFSYDHQNRLTSTITLDTTSFSDDFNTKDASAWTWSSDPSYQTAPYPVSGNNVVKSTGQPGTSYAANFYRSSYSLTSGEGVHLRFQLPNTSADAIWALEAPNRRFSVAYAPDGPLMMQYYDGSWHTPATLLAAVQAGM